MTDNFGAQPPGAPGWIGPGSRIVGYVIEAQIGAGGMAVVYRARDEALGRLAAVKVLSPALAADQEFRSRFMRESRMVAGVDHPHVIPVYGAGDAGGVLYIATRFIPGGDLAEVMRRNGGPLEPERAAAIIAHVASALDAAHEIGLVHRDVKPGNVLIDTARGKIEHAYLSDFGLTRGTSSTTGLTSAGQFLGTPDYCAPEQIRGLPVDGRADQYALACLAFALLAGAPPFHREEAVATLFAHLNDPVPPAAALRPQLPPGVNAVLARALAKIPGDRFASCGEFAAALRHALSAPSQPPVVLPPPGGSPAPVGPAPDITRPPAATPLPPLVATLPPGTAYPGTISPPGAGIPPAGYGAPPGRLRGRRKMALVAGVTAAVLVAAGVGAVLALPGSRGPTGSAGSSSSGPVSGATGGTAASGYDAGLASIVNPSARKGGTLTLADSGTLDSLDPGNTYYAWTWDFSRLYATPLVTFKSAPGLAGNTLVPGIATGLGHVSADGLTWTYHIKQGLKFSDGSPITAADVKYAVMRTYDRDVLGNGPSYFQVLLADPGYPGPYKAPGTDLTSVTTPDPSTIEFHLVAPFADFDYVVSMPQTAPVPKAKDTGASYQFRQVSSGPYEFQGYQQGKQVTLVPNPYFTPQEDTEARQLLSKVVLILNSNTAVIDSGLLAGDLDLDATGASLEPASVSRVLSSGSLKAGADDVPSGHLWLAYLNTKVAPLDNVACRQAVEYAANKAALQTAYGGPAVGGDIAATLQLPGMAGYRAFDLYNAKSQPAGDLADARKALARCGKPGGFTTSAAYRSDRPREAAAAQALQAALAQVGIKVQLKGYPTTNYYLSTAGSPSFVHQHGLGIAFGGWQPDWPDGYGMLNELVDGTSITATYNVNISELSDPVVNDLFTQASSPGRGPAARNAIYTQIDRQAMKDAAILPMVDAKAMLYRNQRLANAYVEASYGMYNYAVLGLTS